MKKLLAAGLLTLGIAASAWAETGIRPTRVGPVSQYGQLQAKALSGVGRIVGSCSEWNNKAVEVQGMSLFWAIAGGTEGADYWTDATVTELVNSVGIQLIRAPMGIYEDWGEGNYSTNQSYYKGMIDDVVRSAIKNDIYVIVDAHSHNANESGVKDVALGFLEDMAKEWGSYDNVIFEVFNEPLDGVQWSSIKSYAEEALAIIRQYSDNLVVVGTRAWDQHPEEAARNPINDKNVAYTFHFYAGIDDDGAKHEISSEGSNAESAMNSGYSVFVTEWGNSGPKGNGTMNETRSKNWINWMHTNKLSGANWSVSAKAEKASYYWSANSKAWTDKYAFAGLSDMTYSACDGSSVIPEEPDEPAEVADGLIDDLEDGDAWALTGGFWMAYNDNGSEDGYGYHPRSNFENEVIGESEEGDDIYQVVFNPGNSSDYAAGLKGINLDAGNYMYDPFVDLALSLKGDQSKMDLTNCSSISYDYKGASHNFKVVMADDYDCDNARITGCNQHQHAVEGSSTWKTETILWSNLRQEDDAQYWGYYVALNKTKIGRFVWDVREEDYNYLYVDNVRCTGLEFEVVPSPSEDDDDGEDVKPGTGDGDDDDISTGNSSSSSKRSSSSKGSKPSSDDDDDDWDDGDDSDDDDDWDDEDDSDDDWDDDEDAIASLASRTFRFSVRGRTLDLGGMKNVNVFVFDMQGRPMTIRHHVSGQVSLEGIRAGHYIVRVTNGSKNLNRKIILK